MATKALTDKSKRPRWAWKRRGGREGGIDEVDMRLLQVLLFEDHASAYATAEAIWKEDDPKQPANVDVQQGRRKLADLVEDLKPLVVDIASRILVTRGSRITIRYEDAVSLGMVGLIQAFLNYDPSRGGFAAFAIPRVRGAILDDFRRVETVPRSLQQFRGKLSRLANELGNELGRTPTNSEVAKKMGMSLDEFLSTLAEANQRTISLEEWASRLRFDDPDTAIETADDDPEVDPQEKAVDGDMVRLLREAIQALPQRDRDIIRLRYEEGLPFHRVGTLLGLSESRVCQLHKRILRALRARLKVQLDGETTGSEPAHHRAPRLRSPDGETNSPPSQPVKKRTEREDQKVGPTLRRDLGFSPEGGHLKEPSMQSSASDGSVHFKILLC